MKKYIVIGLCGSLLASCMQPGLSEDAMKPQLKGFMPAPLLTLKYGQIQYGKMYHEISL